MQLTLNWANTQHSTYVTKKKTIAMASFLQQGLFNIFRTKSSSEQNKKDFGLKLMKCNVELQ